MPSSTIQIRQGNDYSAVGQGPITWTLTGAPNLTGATITLTVARGATAILTAVGALVGSTYPAAQVVNVPLTDAQTDTLVPMEYAYGLNAVLSNGDEVTLDAGYLVTRPSVGA